MSENDFKNKIKYDFQTDFENELYSLINTYQKSNSFNSREYLCYLTAAIYLTYKKLFPQLSIYIPFRIKSDISFIKNIQKEAGSVIPYDYDNEPMNSQKIIKDISALKIVLDDINYSRPAKGESEKILNDPFIKKLMNESKKNSDFVEKVSNYLYSPIKNSKEHYRLKKELLKRIIEITPPEFIDERKPHPPYSELYEDVKKQYDFFMETDGFPTIIYNSEIDQLSDLLNVFRSRIDDRLHFVILNKTLPIVFEDPLIKNALKASYEFEKESKKSNGFQAIYYMLHTPFGIIESQAQSNKAYYASTKGSSYHSGITGKTVNIKNFFELADPNDEHDISYYLDALDSTSADTLISPYEIPEFKDEKEESAFLESPRGKEFLASQDRIGMIDHIKIKSKMQIVSPEPPDTAYTPSGEIDLNVLKDLQESNPEKYKFTVATVDANDYLLSTALSLCPYMNVCSSGHTSTTTAEIHHKKIIGEFSEILRKKDSNTCLRDLLIRRLDLLIKNNGVLENESPESISNNRKMSIKQIKEHEEASLILPKDISRKNILNYAERLSDMEKTSNTDNDLSL